MSQSSVEELYLPSRECWENTQKQYFQFQSEVENVAFQDDEDEPMYSFPKAIRDLSNDAAPEEMGDFLSRPVLIKTLTWLPAGVSDSDFDPWYTYLNNSIIKNKINNFAFFRGNMHIKVVVNASPFYYGALLINYTPTQDYVQAIDNTHVTALVNQSQKPHIWIDLRTNMGGEMILPFMYHHNFVDVTSGTDVQNLGRLRNITYVGLSSANSATVRGVTIKIYAWMEDVVLTGNTAKLALQAKKQVVDEYKPDGVISRPASALAHWASYLTAVPVIGTYAKATQIGASAVSSVAGLFGWSKVPVIEDVKPVKPLFFHDLSSAEISEPMVKYTLDPKAELTVDPRIVGPSTGVDELSISHLVQKDSFLTSTVWSTADAADTYLFSALATPNMYNAGSPTSTVYTVGFTPMGYIAEAFQHWRGDIIFTIKIVCSQYHRGRLRIHWDPAPVPGYDTMTTTDLTKIVDIGDTTEVEFRIPYVNRRPWLRTHGTMPSTLWATSNAPAINNTYDNGKLHIFVHNTLSAPIDTSTVTVMIFVRGAENLEFANPKDVSDKYSFFTVQGLVEDVETSDNVKSTPLVDRYLINFGEAVPSLRLLLQRSTLHQAMSLGRLTGESASATMLQYTMRQGRFPTSPGYDQLSYYMATGVVNTGASFYYNFCHMTPLAWFTPMFVARRGSIQWHFAFHDPDDIVKSLSLERSTTLLIPANSNYLAGGFDLIIPSSIPTPSVLAKNFQTHTSSDASGVAVTEATVNPSLSVEMPQMTSAKYCLSDPYRITTGYTEDETTVDNYMLRANMKVTALSQLARTVIYRYCNAGTDFSLNMFLCVPQVTYCATSGDSPV